ncbi:flagellar hook capping FlgD N-terminal domain-containing protein [Pelagicoccus sp. SDUM812005]|uniref:flagellar hook capping FlgD N-terminal domain-containing protein n=1 Tax=Pelagicoccus sp. SDUM812005 TaxID=3041257 RepID=UPI00280D9FDB|nr:flagellar hook capping FlgD N-terminal domain-containing protein [Pelagicoccus sp. SDUM812005]MDQ8182342.1 flagellar hook capping FlgD N-terminal domain-containing protein [Pelagicoccus sp. SDUM812005]
MPVDAIGSTAQTLDGVTTTSSGSSGQDRVEQQALGQDEFFKLLTTQLASQDPLEPMEDTAFIAQMASFSQLEMTSEMTKSFDKMSQVQQFASAHGYIGKTVSLSTGEEGMVTSVERQNGETIVFLDGSNTNGRSVDNIFRVAPGGGDTGAVSSSKQVSSDIAQAVADAITQAAQTITEPFVGEQSSD